MPTSLKALLDDLNIECKGQPGDWPVAKVTDDSRKADAESLFVAVEGAQFDGHEFLGDAAGRGCRMALVGKSVSAPSGMKLIQVEQPRLALALIAQRLAGDPSHAMKVVGVTGTNGKTTVVYLMEAIFREAGLKPGVMGTINYRWGDRVAVESAPQTTPSPTDIAEMLAQMREDGVEAVAMEVSSHALSQYRVDGVRFEAAALTNITQDHLDYHRTMQEYAAAKERLFTEVLPRYGKGVSVLNFDDPAGRGIAWECRNQPRLNYSLYHEEAELQVADIHFHRGGMRIDVVYSGEKMFFSTPLHGLFNAMNCLTTISLALAAGIDRAAIERGLAKTGAPPGRFEFVDVGQPFPIIVDYAHTPDSVMQLLLNARGFARRRLIALVGAGGDRDPAKRPLMGQAAGRLAEYVLITNDNPRSEDPQVIAEAVEKGVAEAASPHFTQWEILLDRREAIRKAVMMASENDAIVIAGKGHETYQIIGKDRHHFDDREEARQALRLAGYEPKPAPAAPRG